MIAACSASPSGGATEPPSAVGADAPIVAAAAGPGAWFDAQGGLTIVGPGRRLRLALSAPLAACAPVFEGGGSASEQALNASLPFQVLSEACREVHPSILLPEESRTASPAELERTYHEVSRCVANELGGASGWVPDVVADGDPCTAALGRGFRLPSDVELEGLSLDDRKAVAGALFDTDDHAAFGSLLLYAKNARDELVLVTLSPNAAERAPQLTEAQRKRPFFGAALRCVRPNVTDEELSRLTPRLPNASACLRALRAERTQLRARPSAPVAPELLQLRAWVEQAARSPILLQSAASLRELGELLSAPALERMAQEAQSERALTEHYAELAEGLDDPSVSPGERARRRAEFDSLRKRLSAQLVQSAEAGGGRTQLSALVAHLQQLLEAAARAKPGRRGPKLDYAPVLTRLRALTGAKAGHP